MPTGEIGRFDYDGAGSLGAARPFHRLSGRRGLPDGSTVDAEGCLWNTIWGGGRIVRYSPDGETLLEIDLPVPTPPCLAFGHSDYPTPYLTPPFFQIHRPEDRREGHEVFITDWSSDVCSSDVRCGIARSGASISSPVRAAGPSGWFDC